MGNPAGLRKNQRAKRRVREARRLAEKVKRVAPLVEGEGDGLKTLAAELTGAAAVFRPSGVRGADVAGLQQVLTRANAAARQNVADRRPEFERWVSSNYERVRDQADNVVGFPRPLQADQGGAGLEHKPNREAWVRTLEAADAIRIATPTIRKGSEALPLSKEGGNLCDLPQNIHSAMLHARVDPNGVWGTELVLFVLAPPSPRFYESIPGLTPEEFRGVPVRTEVSLPAIALGAGKASRNRWYKSLAHMFGIGRRRNGTLVSGAAISREGSPTGTITCFARTDPIHNPQADCRPLLLGASHVLLPQSCGHARHVYHPGWDGGPTSQRVGSVRGQPMQYGMDYVTDAAVAELDPGVRHEPCIHTVGPVVGDLPLAFVPGGRPLQAELYGQRTGLCCLELIDYHHFSVIFLEDREQNPSAYVRVSGLLAFKSVPHPLTGLTLRPDNTDSGAPVFVRTGIGGQEVRIVGMLIAGALFIKHRHDRLSLC